MARKEVTSETYLVAGEAEDDKALLLVLVVQALETLVLRCETAAQHDETDNARKNGDGAYHFDATFTMRTTLPLSCSKS